MEEWYSLLSGSFLWEYSILVLRHQQVLQPAASGIHHSDLSSIIGEVHVLTAVNGNISWCCMPFGWSLFLIISKNGAA